jgi:transposase InsO family protein
MDWQVGFTYMSPVKRIKYLLVLVDTLTGWVEAFPITNKKASTVTPILVTEIIPQFGLPASIQSDNRPEFVSSISQKLAQALNIHWKFHIPYHPQSSGKVEHANHTLKSTLTKLSLELHLDWTKLLLWLQALLKRPLMLSPLKLLYGHLLLPIMVQSEPPNISPTLLNPLLTYLHSLLWSHAHDQLPQPNDTTEVTPSLQMGDLVYQKNAATPGHLQEKWRGPFKVILTTPMAAKLAGFPSWVHVKNLKLAAP